MAKNQIDDYLYVDTTYIYISKGGYNPTMLLLPIEKFNKKEKFK